MHLLLDNKYPLLQLVHLVLETMQVLQFELHLKHL